MNEAARETRKTPTIQWIRWIRYDRAFRWLLLGAWLLMMPPVPLGTELPPLSKWRKVSTHKTDDACERSRDELRKAARSTVTSDPNAHAVVVAAALGGLQAKCVEDKSAGPPATPAPITPPPATPAPATPPPAEPVKP